ncbi:MAG: hypothetical protein GEV11_17900 [Streptosporangiales bacterium]|nr:hypothetical protein [Streptosporangiales bacterium]
MTNPYNQPHGGQPGPVPNWGPQQAGPAVPPPQAPKESNPFKTTFLGCLGVIVAALVLFAGCAALGGTLSAVDPSATPSDPAASSTEAAEDETQAPEARRTKPAPSEAKAFKDCIKKDGTPAERRAVAKVVKVTGVETRNDILDNAEVHTDLQGDLFGPDANDAKIIASAFTTCYQSDNGLVTVYSEDGELLSTGNF